MDIDTQKGGLHELHDRTLLWLCQYVRQSPVVGLENRVLGANTLKQVLDWQLLLALCSGCYGAEGHRGTATCGGE